MSAARVAAVLAWTTVWLAGAAAHAQPDAAAEARARSHFDRGVALFDEGRFEPALIEFEAAYALVPSYRLLYNIGNVHAALGRAVDAAAAYERYLAEAGDRIERRRRREVEAALASQRSRIGRVMVRTNVEGAAITVDGVDVATTPLDTPIALAVGSYAIGARAAGWEGATRRVEVAGETEQTLEIELRRVAERQGTLRITANVSDVEVSLDGRAIGRTPLDQTVPVAEGAHVVEGARDGYRVAREPIEIEHGVERSMRLVLERDPAARADVLGTLELVLPAAPRTVEIDGEPVDGDVIELPIGAHELAIAVSERLPVRERVVLAPRASIELAPDLRWTEAGRRARVEDADAQRTLGLIVGVSGLVVAGVGVAVLIWNEGRAARQEEIRPVWECDKDPTLGTPTCLDLAEDLGFGRAPNTDGHLADEYETLDSVVPPTRIGAIAGIVLGAGAAALGAVLHIGAPTDAEIDAAASAPSARLEITPAGARLAGTF